MPDVWVEGRRMLEDAVRGVDVNPGDSERAIGEMVAAGAKKATLDDLTSQEIIDIF